MSVIKVENLTFSYPSGFLNVFENVSFRIDTDWKLGFVGRNGRGKTTFLKLLCGEYEYCGKIISSVGFDYFPYRVTDKNRLTYEVLSDVCKTAEPWELIRELSYLELREDALYRPFYTLSSGEQTKALLSALFLNEGRFLLIDEPTDHLDISARETLAEYLNSKKGFIAVSHDRCFLDNCVDHILSLNRSNIEVRRGNFSSFLVEYETTLNAERAQNKRLKTEIDRLKDAAERTADWANAVETSKIGAGDKGYVGHKSAKMMKRAKCTERRLRQEVEKKSMLFKNAEMIGDLKLTPLVYRAERIAAFNEVSPVYDGNTVCPPVTFEIKRGDRISLSGKNGSGKSSLLKLLCGFDIDHTGNVYKNGDLIISYLAQEPSALSGTLTEFARTHNINETLFKTILYKMGLGRELFEKRVSELSDGQKKKILIAKSLSEQAHLYVWDEPLNYIDVFSRMQIEELIKEFQPTLIFVEHDKAFRDNIATRNIKL